MGYEKYYNVGKIDVERARAGILKAGGGENREDRGSYVHITVYLTSRSWRLSYDDYGNGDYRNVHSTTDKIFHLTYGGAF